MTKLSPMERKGFVEIFEADFAAIQAAIANQIEKIWNSARKEIEKQEGLDKLYEERDKLKKEREQITQRLHEIEQKITSDPLTKQQVIELGGHKDGWDKYRGANFFGIPVDSQFEYKIVQLIKEHIDLDAPAKYVYDLHKSCQREVTMCGTFEQAKAAYEKFYALDFRKYGIDIPPRLDDVKQRSPLLQGPKSLLLEQKEEDNGNE